MPVAGAAAWMGSREGRARYHQRARGHRPAPLAPPAASPGPPPPAGRSSPTWAAWPSCTRSPPGRPPGAGRSGGRPRSAPRASRRSPRSRSRPAPSSPAGSPRRWSRSSRSSASGSAPQAAHGGTSYWLIMPQISGAVDVGPDPGVATFYPYLPDLSLAQVMFLAGLTVAALGVLGLPGRFREPAAARRRRGPHRGRPAGRRDRRRRWSEPPGWTRTA